VYVGGVVIVKRCFCLTLKMMAWHIGVRVIGDPLSRLPTLNILYAFYPNLYIQEDKKKKKNRSSDYIGSSNVFKVNILSNALLIPLGSCIHLVLEFNIYYFLAS